VADEGSSREEITGGFRFASPGFKDGYRWKVEGDRARFISPEVIEISPVRAVISSETESEYVIKMDWAQLNRTTKDVWSDAQVEVIKDNSKMTGIGLRWYTARKLVRILKNVKMTLDLGDSNQWQFK
jgi:lipopolysaccharide export system protein LptC